MGLARCELLGRRACSASSPLLEDRMTAPVVRIPTTGVTLTERVYAEQDANWNTTATRQLTYSEGVLTISVERYETDPYGGNVLVLNNDFTVKGTGGGGTGQSDRAWLVFFQGGFSDRVTGLIHFGARIYDPTQGRWKQQDPAGWPDGANNQEFVRGGRFALLILRGNRPQQDPPNQKFLLAPDPDQKVWVSPINPHRPRRRPLRMVLSQ